MQFNTYFYILVFLPVSLIGWFGINRISRRFHKGTIFAKIYLVLVSFFFFSYAGKTSFFCLILSIAVNYTVILLLYRFHNKAVLVIGIIADIALLFYFKYLNFAVLTVNSLFHTSLQTPNIMLPLGISFFTFQQISYLVDYFKGEVEEHSFLNYLLYVTFFPKILMGPIVRQRDLMPQFGNESKGSFHWKNFNRGAVLFITGLFKKVVLADTFAKAVNWAWSLGGFQSLTSGDVFLIMLAYTFQIYFDFSGYSDMAIGSACMMNISLQQNFNSPYQAYSIRDFWKRWHISLTSFFAAYVYIPLGGNRKGKLRTYLNTLVVFIISGLWHGANWTFVLWGGLHGLLSVLDRATERCRKWFHPSLQWIATFFAICILWLLFRSDSITQWVELMRKLFSFESTFISQNLISQFVNPETTFFLQFLHVEFLNERIRGLWMLLFYMIALLVCLGFENVVGKKDKRSIVSAVAYAVLFVFALTCIGSESVFIYNNF